jgi:prepilin-type N-terminal cleavage/methylation domain-containing protein
MMPHLFMIRGGNWSRTSGRKAPLRQGITLVELIVAIAIIGILAGMVLAFWPGVQEQARAASGASMFEGWMRLAKARAQKDGLVRGLRLILNSPTVNNHTNHFWVTQCQLLDQPDDFYIQGYNVVLTGTTISFGSFIPATVATNGSVVGVPVGQTSFVPAPTFNLSGGGGAGAQATMTLNNIGQALVVVLNGGRGYSPLNPPMGNFLFDFYQGQQFFPSLWAVQGSKQTEGQGDRLEVNGSGQTHQIVDVPVSGNGMSYTLKLAPIVQTVGTAAIFPGTNVPIPLASAANLTVGCFLDLDLGAATQETVFVSGLSFNATATKTLPVGPVATVAAVTKPHRANFTAQSHGITGAGPNGQGTGGTYRIIRAPRIAGDELLQLPSGLVVDLNTNMNAHYAYPNNPLPFTFDMNNNPTSLDILFSPSGTVVTSGVFTDFIALWVRDLNFTNASQDPTLLYPGPGNGEFLMGPTIIAVWTRSGLIAAHPPNDAPVNGVFDPYQFVRDGRSQ